MLESLQTRVYGRVAEALQTRLTPRTEMKVKELLLEATELWREEGFNRWGDGELACTVRLYDCCDRILRATPRRWPLMKIQYDGALPTSAMRRGDEDPAKSPRPDINICVGSVAVHIEAKRLQARERLPVYYVQKGMKRFIDGRYPATMTLPGMMIGYVLHDSPADSVTAVNVVITGDTTLGSSHTIKETGTPSPVVLSGESVHFDETRLIHYQIDLNGPDRQA